MYQWNLKVFQLSFRVSFESVKEWFKWFKDDSRLFQRSFKIAFRKCQGCFKHISRMFFMGVWRIFQECWKLQECFKRTSRLLKWKFQKNFICITKVLPGTFKGVSTKNSLVFQRRFMRNFWVNNEGFMGISQVFLGSFVL